MPLSAPAVSEASSLKETLLSVLKAGILAAQTTLGAAADLPLDAFEALVSDALKLERPRHAQHGDYAVNISFLSKAARLAPPAIAAKVLEHLPLPEGMDASAVAGFINLRLSDALLLAQLLPVLQGQQAAGANRSHANERILLEYVSANPTGPLHLGHGRWAALGDSLRRILEHSGATVCSEFYINDYGNQMTNMANSVWFRSLEALGLAAWPTAEEGVPFPYYPGAYVTELAEQLLPRNKAALQAAFDAIGAARLEASEATLPLLATLKRQSRDAMLALQQDLLARFRTRFDVWQFESTLHEEGLVEAGLNHLKATGYTYQEQDEAGQNGALWLKSTAFGDEKDRVLVKSDGSYTYLAADVAYHDLKYRRSEGFNRYIDIWGADHHGYIPRIQASLQALGRDASQFEVLLGQLVNLVVDGNKARMGKRKTMLTLSDIIDEVGVDACRFWLVSRSADSTIEFDVDLAASRSDENPVFYTQYAHARCAGIRRMATQPSLPSQAETESQPPRFSKSQLEAYQTALTPEAWEAALLAPLKDAEPTTYATVRELILFLLAMNERVADAARVRSPQLVARYALDLSAQFHSFYAACRVLCPQEEAALARLSLVETLRRCLAQSLDLLGVSAPETM